MEHVVDSGPERLERAEALPGGTVKHCDVALIALGGEDPLPVGSERDRPEGGLALTLANFAHDRAGRGVADDNRVVVGGRNDPGRAAHKPGANDRVSVANPAAEWFATAGVPQDQGAVLPAGDDEGAVGAEAAGGYRG